MIFQIHYVGSDEDAKRFIDQLDAKLGHFIFCNKEPLNKVVLDPAMSDAQRNRKVSQINWRYYGYAIKNLHNRVSVPLELIVPSDA